MDILFGSLKTGGLFLALSAASFSFFALSGRINSLDARNIPLADYFYSMPRKDLVNVSE